MGVNWQNNDLYKSLKDYEKESGTTLAERNALANPFGSHTFLGALGVQALPQLICGGLEKVAGSGLSGSGDTGSTTDVAGNKSLYQTLGATLKKFDTAFTSNNISDIDKYLGELEQLKKDNPKNRTIEQAYETALKKKKSLPS